MIFFQLYKAKYNWLMLSFQANHSHFYKVLCLKGNEALNLCMNDQCQRPAFVCSNKSCKCRSEHKNCYYAVASSVIEKVRSKVINTNDLQNRIANYMKIMIEKMNLFYETLVKHFQHKSKYFGLMRNEQDFLSSLDQLSVNKITGKNIADICSNLKPNKQSYRALDQLKDQVESHFESFFIQLKQFQESMYIAVEGMSESLPAKYTSSKYVVSAQTIPTVTQSYQSILVNPKSQTVIKIQPKMFENSKIIKSQEDQQNLLSFFNKRKIKSTTLLYRASQNGFSTKRFHVECDQVANTLIVCKTENGRLIGGYTPLMWQIVKGEMSQERDPSMNTFIFSLTENLKFAPIKLRQKSSTFSHISSGVSIIKHTSEIGPCFGKFQFVIKQDAHTQGENAWIRYEKSNPSFDYIQTFHDPRQYFKAMLGSQQPYFRTREWQVWKIKFRNQATHINF